MNKKLHVRETAQVEKEKKTVADFVDVEVDVKPAPKLTDRRFDSVGPIRVAHEFSVVLMPKGGS